MVICVDMIHCKRVAILVFKDKFFQVIDESSMKFIEIKIPISKTKNETEIKSI